MQIPELRRGPAATDSTSGDTGRADRKRDAPAHLIAAAGRSENSANKQRVTYQHVKRDHTAAAHERFNSIHQVVPMCTQSNTCPSESASQTAS